MRSIFIYIINFNVILYIIFKSNYYIYSVYLVGQPPLGGNPKGQVTRPERKAYFIIVS